MAGHIITLYFKEQGYDVTGFTRRPISFCKNIIGDAMNPNDVKAAILSDDLHENEPGIDCIESLLTITDRSKSWVWIILEGE